MATKVEAIYEQGVFRLKQPIPLADGTLVEITIVIGEEGELDQTPARILASIAALPLQDGGEVFSGRDHDRILYGDKDAR